MRSEERNGADADATGSPRARLSWLALLPARRMCTEEALLASTHTTTRETITLPGAIWRRMLLAVTLLPT